MIISLNESIETIRNALKDHDYNKDNSADFLSLNDTNFDKFVKFMQEFNSKIAECKFAQENIYSLSNENLTNLLSEIINKKIILTEGKKSTQLTTTEFTLLFTGASSKAKFHNKNLFEPLAALFYQARPNKNLNFGLIVKAKILDTALHDTKSDKLDAIIQFREDCYKLINGSVGKRAGKALLKAIGVVAAMAAVIFVAAVIGAIMFYPTTLVGFAAIVFAALAAANPAAITITASVGVASLAVGGLAAYGLFKKSAEEKAVDDVVKNAKTDHSANIFEEPTIASRAYDRLTSCFRSREFIRL